MCWLTSCLPLTPHTPYTMISTNRKLGAEPPSASAGVSPHLWLLSQSSPTEVGMDWGGIRSLFPNHSPESQDQGSWPLSQCLGLGACCRQGHAFCPCRLPSGTHKPRDELTSATEHGGLGVLRPLCGLKQWLGPEHVGVCVQVHSHPLRLSLSSLSLVTPRKLLCKEGIFSY